MGTFQRAIGRLMGKAAPAPDPQMESASAPVPDIGAMVAQGAAAVAAPAYQTAQQVAPIVDGTDIPLSDAVRRYHSYLFLPQNARLQQLRDDVTQEQRRKKDEADIQRIHEQLVRERAARDELSRQFQEVGQEAAGLATPVLEAGSSTAGQQIAGAVATMGGGDPLRVQRSMALIAEQNARTEFDRAKALYEGDLKRLGFQGDVLEHALSGKEKTVANLEDAYARMVTAASGNESRFDIAQGRNLYGLQNTGLRNQGAIDAVNARATSPLQLAAALKQQYPNMTDEEAMRVALSQNYQQLSGANLNDARANDIPLAREDSRARIANEEKWRDYLKGMHDQDRAARLEVARMNIESAAMLTGARIDATQQLAIMQGLISGKIDPEAYQQGYIEPTDTAGQKATAKTFEDAVKDRDQAYDAVVKAQSQYESLVSYFEKNILSKPENQGKNPADVLTELQSSMIPFEVDLAKKIVNAQVDLRSAEDLWRTKNLAAAEAAKRKKSSTGGAGRVPISASVTEVGKKYIGTPYKWGGSDPKTGLDCSGFTCRVFKEQGISLPRTAAEQFKKGRPVAIGDAQPGDLLFFRGTYGKDPKAVTHVGIYVGLDANGVPRMLDAGSDGVNYTTLKPGGYFDQRFVGVRRFTKNA